MPTILCYAYLMDISQLRVGDTVTATATDITMTFTISEFGMTVARVKQPDGKFFGIPLDMLDQMELSVKKRPLPTEPGSVIRITQFEGTKNYACPAIGVRTFYSGWDEVNNWNFTDANGYRIYPKSLPREWTKL